MKSATWIAVGLVALAAAWAGFQFRQSGAPQSQTPQSLTAAPLLDLTGQSHHLDEWRGKPRVVNFWATWCPPCREEIPELSHVQTKIGSGRVQFIGIAIDDTQQVRDFLRAVDINYPILIGDPGVLQATSSMGNANQGLPFTVVLGADSRVLWTKLGRVSEAELEVQLGRLLAR